MLRSASVSRFRASPLAGVFSGAEGIVSPLQLPGAAAWYDVSDLGSMRNDAGAIPSNGEGVKLISDKSGNSSVNVLVMGSGTGNRCSLTTGTAIGTGGFTISGTFIVPPTAVTSGVVSLSASATTNNQARAVYMETRATGDIWFTLIGATTADFRSLRVANFQSTYANQLVTVTFTRTGTTVAAYVTVAGVTATLSGSETTGGTPPAWSDTVTSTATNIGFNATTEVMSGPMYYAAVYSTVLDAAGIIANAAGTVQSNNVVFVNFTQQTKLDDSFTATSGQTVTITTSGATGARISGARDLYQGTAANQPILTIAAGGNYLTFDGSNDYLKAAAFSLSQPETVYFVGSQVTWTNADGILDGNALLGMSLRQAALTPEITASAGNGIGPVSLATGTNGIISAVFNGASSSVRVNRATAATGNASTNNAGGLTIGARGDASNPGNITASEVLVYSTAQNTAQQDAVILYEGRKWGLSV